MCKTTLAIATIGALLLAPVAAGAGPATVLVDGVLANQGGGAAPDGGYDMSFSLYNGEEAPIAEWSEGPVVVKVTGGQFAYALGTTKPLPQAVLAKLGKPWIGVKLQNDPELPRRPLHSVAYALRAAAADGVECSGCIGLGHIDPKLFDEFAKKSALHKVAFSGKAADLDGGLDLSAYAKKAELAKVAVSGAYPDLSGTPSLADVALSGKYGDLKDAPQFGKKCGTGLVVAGVKADGSLECVPGADASNLPKDTLDKISQGVLSNFITRKFASTALPKDIPDNNPDGVSDTMSLPDLGAIESATVKVVLKNSNWAGLTMTLKGPDGTTVTLWQGGEGKDAFDKTFPPTALAKGAMTDFTGKGTKGTWTLQLADAAYLNNKTDGQLLAWELSLSVHSNQMVQVKGSLVDEANQPFGRMASAASDALSPGQALTVKTTATTPAVSAQAWVWDDPAKKWVQAATGSDGTSGCAACGNGSEGDFSSSGNQSLSGTHNYKDFTINAGHTVTGTGGSPLVILATGKVTIHGTLQLSGGKGTDATTCCPDNPGGTAGAGGGTGGTGNSGQAQSGSGSGGGGGGCNAGYGAGGGGGGHTSSGQNGGTSGNSCGSPGGGGGAYGNATFAGGITAGSGGGAGGYGAANNSCGSGGGGGGGAVTLIGGSILVGSKGSILANGGAGGAVINDRDGGAGGGGSGGGIWLRGATIDMQGIVEAKAGAAGKTDKMNGYGGDGGDGSVGRIRVDGYAVTGATTPNFAAGDKTGLGATAARLRIDQQPAGTVIMTNESASAHKVWLVVTY
jgi:subtilisin-like proprotein convertase family protein